MSKRNKIITRVLFTISFLILLIIAVFAYMLNYTNLETTIGTGTIDLNFNDGIVIFDDEDLNLQPGESVIKEMFIENVGTEDFYYRIYLENVSGDLADVTVVNIYDENDNLLQSIATSEFDSSSYFTTDEIVTVGEIINLKIEIVFVEESGNTYQDENLSFDIVASAIQSKNNSWGAIID